MSELAPLRNVENGTIYSHIRKKWLIETPEEKVRQAYLPVLVNDYDFHIDQIGEEFSVTGRGSGQARADFVIWRTRDDRINDRAPFIVVECKSDNVEITPADYTQGENYARIANAPFFVTHNSSETKYWRVQKDRIPGYIEEIENIPHAGSSEAEVKDLLKRLRVFKEREFADLLHQCHNIIRNREHKDPAAAFDEIAKVLFTKVFVERDMLTRHNKTNIFTTEVLRSQISEDPLNALFSQTKIHYAADKIFEAGDRINLKRTTGEAIVKKLERYNLSDTSEDVKGVAFERFLGRTFRGEIGQFFTPRSVVEFMVEMIDPKEDELVCDPASGSGGFLIRVFEIVRQKILADVDNRYNKYKQSLESNSSLLEEERARLLVDEFGHLQQELNQHDRDSRMWRLANRTIYGTDANDRMARTSKMNMIMHGDGHGGVHHHDGFLNVNGIFEGRFDIIMTNPPFGSDVEPSDKVTESDLEVHPDAEALYVREHGDLYKDAQQRVRASIGKPIASMFTLPRSANAIVKTEILFVERCLDLLKPGGRLAIVLPEGILNNPSLDYVREFVEDRAFVRAVVSLPAETFVSSGANVKCSIIFLTKFDSDNVAKYQKLNTEAHKEVGGIYKTEIQKKTKEFNATIESSSSTVEQKKAARKDLAAYKKSMSLRINLESRNLLKSRFDYPIFMYDAEHVGISGTGEETPNELYPSGNLPAGTTITCLELFRQFQDEHGLAVSSK